MRDKTHKPQDQSEPQRGARDRQPDSFLDSFADSAAHFDPASTMLSPAMILSLQRSVGNAAVVRMLERRRGHEEIAFPGEQGTDPSAGSEMPAVQRASSPVVQRAPVPEVVRSAGRPLPETLREEMEERLGADFGGVRLHQGAEAARSAAQFGASAYTTGDHVVVGRGGIDKHTLAHELTHVVQQRSGPVAGTDLGDGVAVSDPGDRFERAAEANADRVMAAPLGDPVPVARSLAEHPPGRGSEPAGVRPPGHLSQVSPGVAAVQRYGGRHGLAPTAGNVAETWAYAPPVAGPFLAHLDIAPNAAHVANAGNDYQYPVAQVNIRGIEVGEQRGSTRFAPAQRSHTTAWTLSRQALANMAGHPASTLVGYLHDRLAELGHLTVGTETHAGAWQTAMNRANALDADTAMPRPLHMWPAVLSDLVSAYVQAYQLSPATTYADGAAAGHGEPDAMATLRNAEDGMAGGAGLPAEALGAVTRLQDYHASASLPSTPAPGLPQGNLGAANDHFWMTLHAAFPRVAAGLAARPDQAADRVNGIPYAFHGASQAVATQAALAALATDMTQAPVAAPSAVPGHAPVSFKLAAGGLDKGLAVGMLVSPAAMTGPGSLAAAAPAAVNVTRVSISGSERAFTRFKADRNRQGAHLASWSLFCKAVEGLEGRSVAAVVTWVRDGLTAIAANPPGDDALNADWETLRTQVTALAAHAQAGGTALAPHVWTELVSSVMRGYVMLYQASSIASEGPPAEELGRPGGHGESAALDELDRLTAVVNALPAPTAAAVAAARQDALAPAAVHFDHRAARTAVLVREMNQTGPNDPAAATLAFQALLAAHAPRPAVLKLNLSIDAWVRFLRTGYSALFPATREAALRAELDNLLTAQLTDNEMILVSAPTARGAKRAAIASMDSAKRHKS